MADYDNRLARSATGAALTVDAGLRAYMLRVYNYMLVGLGLTGAVAWLTANTPLVNVFYNQVADGQRHRRCSRISWAGSRSSRRWRWCSSCPSASSR